MRLELKIRRRKCLVRAFDYPFAKDARFPMLSNAIRGVATETLHRLITVFAKSLAFT